MNEVAENLNDIMPQEGTMEGEVKPLLNIGVIGMGNCGGQMADLISHQGIDAIAINASEKDLSVLTSENIMMILVGDGKGTGKNREEAEEFLLNKINLVQDDSFLDFLNRNDVIFIASSMGGGFGSGSCLILTELLMKLTDGNKAIIPVGVLPFDSEGYTAQSHAIEWLQDLEKLEVPYMIYDNNAYKDLAKHVAQHKVNTQFVKDVSVIRGDFVFDTSSGGMDNRDMLTVVSIPGRIVVTTIEDLDASDLEDGSIAKTLQLRLQKNCAHAPMVEDKIVKASAIMYRFGPDLESYTITLKEDIQSIFGPHLNDYDNFADVEELVPGTISLILSGLTSPVLRINQLISRRDKLESEIIGKQAAVSRLSQIAGTSSKGKLTVSTKKFASEEDGPKKNIRDSLADFLSERNKT